MKWAVRSGISPFAILRAMTITSDVLVSSENVAVLVVVRRDADDLYPVELLPELSSEPGPPLEGRSHSVAPGQRRHRQDEGYGPSGLHLCLGQDGEEVGHSAAGGESLRYFAYAPHPAVHLLYFLVAGRPDSHFLVGYVLVRRPVFRRLGIGRVHHYQIRLAPAEPVLPGRGSRMGLGHSLLTAERRLVQYVQRAQPDGPGVLLPAVAHRPVVHPHHPDLGGVPPLHRRQVGRGYRHVGGQDIGSG